MCTETARAATHICVFWNIMQCIDYILRFAGWSHHCVSLSSPLWCATASYRNRSYPCIGSFCARHKTSRASYREYAMNSVPTLRSRRLTSCTLNIFIGEANANLNCLKMSTLNNLDHSASLKKTADHSRVIKYQYWMYNALAQLFKWKDQMIFTFLRLDKINP